jgi:hypothetical protein
MRRGVTFVLTASLWMSWFAPTARAQTLPQRVDRVEKELAALKREMASRPVGPPARRGDQGPPGPKGERGAPGPAGEVSFPLALKNAAGKELLALGKNDALAGDLRLSNAEGARTLELYGGDASGPGGYQWFYDRSGKKRAYLGLARDGGSIFQVFNSKEEGVASLYALPNGGGRILVNGKDVHDYAEALEVTTRQGLEPGTVVAVAGPAGRIAPSSGPYDRRVVGVISGAGGLRSGSILGTREDGSNDLPVAVSGQVFVRVCPEGGAIEPGDLLVASSRPGVAMRAADTSRSLGAVIGKALETFGTSEKEEGLVRMMVMLR